MQPASAGWVGPRWGRTCQETGWEPVEGSRVSPEPSTGAGGSVELTFPWNTPKASFTPTMLLSPSGWFVRSAECGQTPPPRPQQPQGLLFGMNHAPQLPVALRRASLGLQGAPEQAGRTSPLCLFLEVLLVISSPSLWLPGAVNLIALWGHFSNVNIALGSRRNPNNCCCCWGTYMLDSLDCRAAPSQVTCLEEWYCQQETVQVFLDDHLFICCGTVSAATQRQPHRHLSREEQYTKSLRVCSGVLWSLINVCEVLGDLLLTGALTSAFSIVFT